MKHVAREKQVPLVDMTTLTKNFTEELGEETTIKCIYVPTDGTHTQATGAACYAALVAQELKQQGILSDYIQEDAPLILNPTSLDFQTIYIGDKATLCFDLTGLKLTPSSGILRLEAPQGMTLSDAPQSSPKTVIELPYSMADYGINVFIFTSLLNIRKKFLLLYLLHMEVISGFFQ